MNISPPRLTGRVRASGRNRAQGKDKVSLNLQRRIAGYEEACRIAERRLPGSSKQYRCPGSRKKI